MFRYGTLNLCDEVLSVFLTPYILYYALPQSSGKDSDRFTDPCMTGSVDRVDRAVPAELHEADRRHWRYLQPRDIRF